MLLGVATHYADKQGFGWVSKSDLDVLIIYLYTKYSKDRNFDAFPLVRYL